jgi:hypothetical protein
MADVAIQNITVDNTPAGTWRVLYVDDATGTPLARLINGSSLLSAVGGAALTGATFTGDVFLPAAAPGLNGATRVTAVDAATGRFAVNGVELGDTGWRRITSWDAAGVVTGEALGTAFAPRSGQDGYVDLRRVGPSLFVRFAGVTRTATTRERIWSTYLLPVGFRFGSDFTTSAPIVVNDSGALTMVALQTIASANRLEMSGPAFNTGTGVNYESAPILAAPAWPSVLPGTAVPGSPAATLS